MSSFDEIEVFVSVVDEGGFTAAARRLGMPKSSVSRKVSELEERLGVQLLQRTTRSVRPTDVGERFYEQARVGVETLKRAEEAASLAQERPRGTLRLTTIPAGGQVRLARLIDRYLSTYPEVSVEVLSDVRTVDLIRDGYDVAIRAGTLEDSSLIARTLGTMDIALFAAPSYLAKSGRPEKPADLTEHQCILFGTNRLDRGATWKLARGATTAAVTVRGRVRLNDLDCSVGVCVEGHGIAALPCPIAARALEAGELERVLVPWCAGKTRLQIVFPSNRLLEPKTRAFVDMAAEHFAEQDLFR